MSRVLIIGPGALGAFTAVRLFEAGHDVTLACRTKDTADHINRHGVVAIDGSARSAAMVPAITKASGSGPFDAIIHATKCHKAEAILARWMPTLDKDGIVIPFQNGVMGDTLAPVAGPGFVECSVYFPATLTETGVSEKTGPGHFLVGHWPSGKMVPGDKVDRAAGLLRAVLPTHIHDDMQAVKWNKLAINSAITSFGVITGETMAGMMQDPRTRKAFLACVKETVAVIRASDIPMVNVGGANLDLLSRLPLWITSPVLKARMRKYKDYRSSSAQSLARGGKTEIDYLNGLVARTGAQVGVPTPVHDAIVRVVHDVEEKRLKASTALVRHVLA